MSKQALGYELTDLKYAVGTSFHDVTVKVDPTKLLYALGDTAGGDEYKCSKTWVLKDKATGAIISIYDWKETSLYDDSLPSPARYWTQPSVELHLGHLKANKAEALKLAAILMEKCGV